MYFTDQGLTGLHDPTGRVLRLRADGRLDCLVDTVPSPNGIVLDREEAHLFVAVTRANQVWRIPLPTRSEEHTSELQSLMRTSYAVFRLKKKQTHTNTHQT